ncbi:MAG: M48 family metallopeptidase [Pseudomonadota bacterium]
MNFFDAQDNARKATRWLVIVYGIATLLIVAGVTAVVYFALRFSTSTSSGSLMSGDPTGLLIYTAVITLVVILGSTMVKTASLSSGGSKVAMSMGGTLVSPDTQDPLKRRLLNVVEEMAIASGVPVPDVFVLEEETAINAFAAGYTAGDAAVAVTRGTLELLDREELQGVIAHEFSHVLNGDMRLNIRMMGILYGIMVIGLLGRLLLRSGHYGALSSRRGKNGNALLMIGLGLAVLGFIGVIFARIIKAAVSRQREYLADASAVQFTRQTRGIAGALKKIGGFEGTSMITAQDPEEVSHMLFGSGMKLSSVFATHPPLTERIAALEPGFDASDYVPVTDAVREQVASEAASQFAGGGATPAVNSESIIEAIGNPQPEHIALAGQIRQDIPESLTADAHDGRGALLLTVALLLDPERREFDAQMAIVRRVLGDKRGREILVQVDQISRRPRALRLSLLEIAFPALKRRPENELKALVRLLRKLIDCDGKTDLYEFCFLRIIEAHLSHAADPSAANSRGKLTRGRVQRAALDLLSVVAREGGSDDPEAAFLAGAATFPKWAETAEISAVTDDAVERLDTAFDLLAALNPAGQKMLVEAVVATIGHDGRFSSTEIEVLRALCAAIGCPVPPLQGVGEEKLA